MNKTSQNQKKLPDEITEIERLAMMGEMLPEIAHEIRNLMQVVSGFIEVELSQNTFTETTQRRLRRSLEHANFASNLTGTILRLAKPQESAPGNPVEAMQVVIDLFRHRQRKGTSMIFESKGTVPPVTLSTGYLELVFANIVKNAFDALENSSDGSMTICIDGRSDPVRVAIHNSGPHIDDKILRHLFTRFTSSKSSDRGTGLGLHIASRLVSQSGGSIRGKNVPSGGVEFAIELPKAIPPSFPTPTTKPEIRETHLNGTRIFVVDDDQYVRDALQLMLVELGGNVVQVCGNGTEALRLVEQVDFDALLLDLRMKGLSGCDVYERLTSELKRRVVFITGDNLDRSAQTFLNATHQPVLIKPVKLSSLIDAIQDVTSN